VDTPGAIIAHVVDRRLAFVQRFHRVLREVADAQVRVRHALAAEQRQFADQGLHQGRLAGAVRAEQADAIAGFQAEIHLVQHGDARRSRRRHGSGGSARTAS
jgi:hypothetical protein